MRAVAPALRRGQITQGKCACASFPLQCTHLPLPPALGSGIPVTDSQEGNVPRHILVQKKEKYSHGEKAALEWQEFSVTKNLKHNYLIIYQKC